MTGATGFVGKALLAKLSENACGECRGTVRASTEATPQGLHRVVGEIGPGTDWSEALSGVHAVVHTAARVHMLHDDAEHALREYRRVNVEGTLSLARQAALAGIRRFIFISSIKVNGERTEPGRPFRADDPPAPVGPYGMSKHEAELGLRALAEASDLEVVIIRPGLVYGPGVKANFLSLMRALHRGLPLPLGAIRNLRSYVALENLVDLICAALKHRAVGNETFLVSDGEDVSTPELARRLAAALDVPARLISLPVPMLRAMAWAVGKREHAERLCGSLQVDIDKTKRLLRWTPVVGLDKALAVTARDFLETRGPPGAPRI